MKACHGQTSPKDAPVMGSMQRPGLFVELLGHSMDGHQPGIQEGQLFTILELGGPSLETCCGGWRVKPL